MIEEAQNIKQQLKDVPKELVNDVLTKKQLDVASIILRQNEKQIANKGREEFYCLRKTWSMWLIVWISALILSQTLVIILIGRNMLNFEKHPNISMAYFIETFAQIVGMGIMVVAFLFKERDNKM